MAITEIKKYLDQQGVSVLWGEVTKKLNEEKARAEAAEQAASAAAAAAQSAADAAQSDVDALEELVGTLPADATVSTVVEYINKKTEGIATDAALAELQNKVTTAEGEITTIKSTHATDKTELQGKIDLKADQTALAAEIARAEGVEAGLQTQINTILENPDAEGAINSIKEFTEYINEHKPIAEAFRTDINKNAADIAAMDTAYKAADSAMDARLSAVEGLLGDGEGNVADQIEAAKDAAIAAAAEDATTKANAAQSAAETTAKNYTDTELAKVDAKVTQNTTNITDLTGRVSTLETNDANKETRIAAMEAKVTNWDAAEANAKAHAETKAAEALASAKVYSDEKLEEAKTHSNNNLATAKAYTETAYANIQALSEAEIKSAISRVAADGTITQ